MSTLSILLIGITFLIMVIGLIGVFLPVLPGIELVWLAALGYGILHGFTWMGGFLFLLITIFVAIGLTSDLWITGLGMKTTGTSLLAIVVGGLLLFFLSIFLTPLAGIAAGLTGLIAVEYIRHRNVKKAVVSAGTAVMGCGLSYGFKFLIGIVMMGIWGIWVLLG